MSAPKTLPANSHLSLCGSALYQSTTIGMIRRRAALYLPEVRGPRCEMKLMGRQYGTAEQDLV